MVPCLGCQTEGSSGCVALAGSRAAGGCCLQATNPWPDAKLISLSRWRDSRLFIYDLEFRSEEVVPGTGVGTFISIKKKNEAIILTSFLQTTSLICPVGLANQVWLCSLDSRAGMSHKANEFDPQPRGFG